MFRIFESQVHHIGKLLIEWSISESGCIFRVSVWLSFTVQPRLLPLARPQCARGWRNSSSGWSSWKADRSNSLGRAPDRVLLAPVMSHRPLRKVYGLTISLALFVGLVVVPTMIWIAWRFIATSVGRGCAGSCSCPIDDCRREPGIAAACTWALAIWLALLVIAITWWFSLRENRTVIGPRG